MINEAYRILGDLDNRLEYKIRLEKYDEYIENLKQDNNESSTKPKNKNRE